MANISRLTNLVAGVERGIDLSINTLVVNDLMVGGSSGTLLSQAGSYAAFSGTIAGTSTSVTITANNPGTIGNAVALVFTGSNTIAAEIATWNGAHPTNQVTLTSGNGSQTPSSITVDLSGGVNAGSAVIGDTASYSNFTPTAATVAGALMGINNALGSIDTSAITSLTGDVTATGPGAAAATLATVNSNVGSFGSSTAIPNFTVNAKGLITAAGSSAVIAPAGTLSGTTLNSSVVNSSLTSVGTITSGTWNGTTIAIANGGTGATSAAAAFNALSPMTTTGDLEYEASANTAARLGIGSTGQVLTVVGGLPAWATPASSGTVTSVALADGSTSPIYSISGSPVTSSGTLTFSLNTQSANTVFAGPGSGSAAQPSFRALVSTDIPSLSSIYLPLAGGTMSGNIAMGGNKVTGLGAPSTNGDALRFDQLGAASGIATLDSGGKVPLSQLPATLMEFKGNWNPNTNTPTLVDGTGTTGYTYWVSAADSSPVSGLNDPSMTNFQIGDLVIYNGSVWVLVTPAAGVTSVNGAQGAVTVNAINQLTGDVTASAASGSQSKVTSLVATSNATLTTLSALTTASSLASVGTITSGTWNATTIAIAHGGTGQTTKQAAFDALSPLGTAGDTLYHNGTHDVALGIGSTGQVLTVVGGEPAWASPASSGTVTSVAFADDSTSPIYAVSGSPVTSSGTLAITLNTQSANTVFAGPSSGSAAQPSFRALVAADVPGVQQTLVAGQSFSANTTYCVRWGMNSNSETTDRVYAADQDTSSKDFFWVIGLAYSTTAVSAGQNINVIMLGSYTLQSSDTAFGTGVVGLPVWLTSAGAFSTTAPSTAGYAAFKVGMVQSTSQIWVDRQMMGVN